MITTNAYQTTARPRLLRELIRPWSLRLQCRLQRPRTWSRPSPCCSPTYPDRRYPPISQPRGSW